MKDYLSHLDIWRAKTMTDIDEEISKTTIELFNKKMKWLDMPLF